MYIKNYHNPIKNELGKYDWMAYCTDSYRFKREINVIDIYMYFKKLSKPH